MGKDANSAKGDVPIRVLHLIDRITGYGTSRLLWDIVRLTPSKELKHCVVTFSPDKGKWAFADRLRELGVYRQAAKPLFLKLGRRPTVWFLTRYLSALWHASKSLLLFRPDVILVHTSYVLPVGLLLKVVSRRPVVHLVPSLFSQMRDQGKEWVPKLYSRFHSRFDCFFVAAYRCRDELLSVGVPEEKLVPFYGLLDLQEIGEVRNKQQEYHEKIRKAAHLPAESLIALSVGRLDPSKGHHFSLEALPALVHRFPNLHWFVLGDGNQRHELEARAKELDVLPHVHLVGHADKPLPYYAAADLYLRTMIFEETNLSTYQAMAMGLPMVGFDTACETELLKRVGHGILVPNQNVEALVKGVTEILSSPDQGRGIGGRGLQYSKANLDMRRSIGDMIIVYKNLKNGLDPREALPVD